MIFGSLTAHFLQDPGSSILIGSVIKFAKIAFCFCRTKINASKVVLWLISGPRKVFSYWTFAVCIAVNHLT